MVKNTILVLVALSIGFAGLIRFVDARDIETCARVEAQREANYPGFFVSEAEQEACDRANF